jgi:transcriptional regulator with XRE-family HTH domain
MSKFNDNFNEDLGNRIKEKRQENNFTRAYLATEAKISGKFLYDIEVGKKGMSANTLYKLKTVLGSSADWLMEGDEKRDEVK